MNETRKHPASSDSGSIASSPAIAWRIDMFGRLAACPAGSESALKRFSRSKTGAVLGWLAYHLDQDHGREMLAERLWPEATADAARHNLNQALYRLRQEFNLEEPQSERLILGSHLHVRLNPEIVTTDVQAFRELTRRARRIGKQSPVDERGSERLDLLSQAIELYRGELLPGYYEEWVLIERERLALQFVDAVVEMLELLASRNECERAMQVGLRAAAVMPCHEDLSAAIMRLYQTLSKPIDGLREYVRLCAALRHHEGRDPGAGANALAVSLKRQALALGLRPPSSRVRRSAGRPGSRGGPGANDAGNQPESTQTPAAEAHAAAPSADSPQDPRRPGLPQWRARFVGRQEELEQLASMLPLGTATDASTRAADSALKRRLITVIGAAGSGKTRFVVEAAKRIRRSFSGEIAYLPLVELKDPLLVVDRVAGLFGVGVSRTADTARSIAARLGEQPVLLILDNIEHLLPAAADTVQRLLDAIPGLVCLCTSREPLCVEAEQILTLIPLATPRPEDPLSSIRESPAVSLFVDRAQLVRPQFQLTERNAAVVAALCRRLDGLPLAIELAAARSNVLTPVQMLERMANRFGFLVASRGRVVGRHQTLQDSIAWSYDLLSPEAKQVFIQLSVFAGGCSLEALETVCALAGAAPESARYAGESLLDLLQQLVDRSMVQFADDQGEGRYTMLQTLHDFAAEVSEPIVAADQSLSPHDLRMAARDRHARYFAGMALGAESSLRSGGASERHAQLSLDDENLETALDRMSASPADAEVVIRVSAALWRYWYWRGATCKGKKRLQSALDLFARLEVQPEQAHAIGPSIRARMLLGLGAITRLDGDFELAERRLLGAEEECESVRERLPALEYRSLRGDICQQLAIVHEHRGETARAIVWQEEALTIFEALADARGIATSQGNLGRIRQKAGELTEAQQCYRTALATYDGLGDTLQCAVVWNNLGSVALEMRDYLGAKLAFETSATTFRALDNLRAMAMPQCNLGNTLVRLGALEQATAVLCEGLGLRRQLGDEIGQAYVLINLGTVAAKQGHHARGVVLIVAGSSILAKRNVSLSLVDRQNLDGELAEYMCSLTPDEGAAAVAFGENLPLNSAVQFALSPESFLTVPSCPQALRRSVEPATHQPA